MTDDLKSLIHMREWTDVLLELIMNVQCSATTIHEAVDMFLMVHSVSDGINIPDIIIIEETM